MNSSVGQSLYDTGNDCLSYFLLGFFAGWLVDLYEKTRKSQLKGTQAPLLQRGFVEGSNRMPPHMNGNQI